MMTGDFSVIEAIAHHRALLNQQSFINHESLITTHQSQLVGGTGFEPVAAGV
jgi:hypothetical protein